MTPPYPSIHLSILSLSLSVAKVEGEKNRACIADMRKVGHLLLRWWVQSNSDNRKEEEEEGGGGKDILPNQQRTLNDLPD